MDLYRQEELLLLIYNITDKLLELTKTSPHETLEIKLGKRRKLFLLLHRQG